MLGNVKVALTDEDLSTLRLKDDHIRKTIITRRISFVESYLTTGDAAQAYLDAGYAHTGKRNAQMRASRLIHTQEIQEMLSRRLPMRNDAERDRIYQEYVTLFNAAKERYLQAQKIQNLDPENLLLVENARAELEQTRKTLYDVARCSGLMAPPVKLTQVNDNRTFNLDQLIFGGQAPPPPPPWVNKDGTTATAPGTPRTLQD